MIRINQIKCPIPHKESDLTDKIKKILHLKSKEPITYEMVTAAIAKKLHLKNTDGIKWHYYRKSIDARKKPELFMVYSVNVKHEQEDLILKRNKSSSVMRVKEEKYCFPAVGSKKLKHRPIIVGAGPAGLFAAYQLALCGYAPIVIERGNLSISISNTEQRVGGSILNEKLYHFLEQRSRLEEEIMALSNLEAEMILSGVHPAIAHKKTVHRTNRLYTQLEELETEFISSNSDNILGTTFFNALCSQYPYPIITRQIETIIERASDRFKKQPCVRHYIEAAEANMKLINSCTSNK